MPDVTPEAATPGQAAYEAHFAALRDTFDSPPWAWERLPHHLSNAWDAAAGAVAAPLRAEIAGYQASCDGWRDENARLEEELDSVRSMRDDWQEAADGWEGNFHAARKDADRCKAERDAAREELAEAKAALQYWPLCPAGCGCRIGATGPDGENDADARECACDGPCCMECRENGYQDAPSYRDLAVKHVMDDLTEAREIIEALREDHGRTDRYRAALERIRDHEPSLPGGLARQFAREALAGDAPRHVADDDSYPDAEEMASLDDLEPLPGIGERMAEAWRQGLEGTGG